MNPEKLRNPGFVRVGLLVWIGLIAGVLYWLLDSLVDALVFDEGTVIGQLLTRESGELWERGIVFGAFIVGTSIAQLARAKLRQVEEALRESEETQRRQAQENVVIAEIGRIISSSVDIDQVYGRFAGEVRKLIPFDRITIGIPDSERGTHTRAYVAGIEVPGRPQGQEYPLANTINEEVIRTRSPLLFGEEDVDEMVRRFPRTTNLVEAGIRSRLVVPLISQDQVIGVLHLHSTEPKAYSGQHVALAQRVGNQIAGAIANAQAYAERKQAEEVLRESEERFRSVLHTASDAIITADSGGRIVLWNEAAEAVFGYSADEAVGKQLTILMPQRFHEAHTKAMERAVSTGALKLSGKTVELVGLRKDGSEFPLDLSLAVWKAEEAVFFTAVVRDIAERKQAEEALRESEQRAVAALEELKATQESLVQAEKLSALGELVAGAAHELNNPLTGVLGFAQLLLTHDLDPEVRQALEQIESEALRAAKVVKHLSSFAQKQEIQAVPLDMNEVLSSVLELKSYDLRVSNIQVQKELAPDLPKILADACQMQTVFLNLINNAQSAVTKARGQGTLRVKTLRVGDKVRATVADDGAGIKPEHLDRVFNPFFTTRAVGEGMGMGLSICHGVVVRHHGRIWVESEYGQGATFHVELPVAHETPEEQAAAPAAEPTATSAAGHILVVDDEETTRNLMTATLHGYGYGVKAYEYAREALELLNGTNYDLLLVDMKMPDMDGKEFFQALSARSPELAPRVVFVTGDTVCASTQEFLAMTGRPVVAKPFDLETLKTVVQEELAKRPRAL